MHGGWIVVRCIYHHRTQLRTCFGARATKLHVNELLSGEIASTMINHAMCVQRGTEKCETNMHLISDGTPVVCDPPRPFKGSLSTDSQCTFLFLDPLHDRFGLVTPTHGFTSDVVTCIRITEHPESDGHFVSDERLHGTYSHPQGSTRTGCHNVQPKIVSILETRYEGRPSAYIGCRSYTNGWSAEGRVPVRRSKRMCPGRPPPCAGLRVLRSGAWRNS